MKFIKLPILWKNGDVAMLEGLGIETTYEEADTKDVYLMEDEIKGFFPDKDPNFTCLYFNNTEMVVNMPIDKFIKLITKHK
jgi:hypothetical protein